MKNQPCTVQAGGNIVTYLLTCCASQAEALRALHLLFFPSHGGGSLTTGVNHACHSAFWIPCSTQTELLASESHNKCLPIKLMKYIEAARQPQ